MESIEGKQDGQYIANRVDFRMGATTYGGGGGDDSRRRSRGLGLPLGNDAFLCVWKAIEVRRGSSRSCCPLTGSSKGLTVYGADDLRKAGDAVRAYLDVGEVLILVS